MNYQDLYTYTHAINCINVIDAKESLNHHLYFILYYTFLEIAVRKWYLEISESFWDVLPGLGIVLKIKHPYRSDIKRLYFTIFIANKNISCNSFPVHKNRKSKVVLILAWTKKSTKTGLSHESA